MSLKGELIPGPQALQSWYTTPSFGDRNHTDLFINCTFYPQIHHGTIYNQLCMVYRGYETQYLLFGGLISWRICLRICGSPHLVSDFGFPSENQWVWIDKNSKSRNSGHSRYSQTPGLWKNSIWARETTPMILVIFYAKKITKTDRE